MQSFVLLRQSPVEVAEEEALPPYLCVRFYVLLVLSGQREVYHELSSSNQGRGPVFATALKEKQLARLTTPVLPGPRATVELDSEVSSRWRQEF